jgi:hypothetical protein
LGYALEELVVATAPGTEYGPCCRHPPALDVGLGKGVDAAVFADRDVVGGAG